ncbi:folylpolyglutamate synthase/dihydrofolate synthase family protein [Angustibacter sp. Root456]|uniref:bifunctional folylpolyglutamate synthase/dihydrofolate synthase n=1 Tax=Angustibacter sp. Root456 TaxID=1736539 RepID=UPI0006F382DE|nr:folylpolyglutamate synthase/dihydrofolate synthase family protein [Angustibacter sp. Root456]KQX68837.1 dihydrofolate synthase [Angustibacter sp. Root456]
MTSEQPEVVSARLAEVEHAVLARTPEHHVDPSLDAIRALMDLMGEPQRAFPVVHITGTNGKTSTSRMIERLLRELGLRTGRFTSPHLTDIRERIAFDGEPISPERFVAAWDDVAPYLEIIDARAREAGEPLINYFQVLTAMAFSAFADAPVDVAVVEVGLGGTWDSTNVADGQVAVITPIGIDHERLLGSTVEQIATEKAGIIKPGAVAVLGTQKREAAEVLLHRAGEVGADVVVEGQQIGLLSREVAVGGQLVSVRGIGGDYEDLFLPLHGEHQAHNLVTAIAAVEAFVGGGTDRLDPEVVRVAVADMTSPGRMEVVRRSPTVVVDAAHNPAGAQVLAAAVDEAFSFRRLVGVVAVLSDKDPEGILAALEPVLDEVVVTRTSSSRAMNPDDLGEVAVEVFGEDRVHVVGRLPDALARAVDLAEQDGDLGVGVLATGSVTMAADVRTLLGVR